MTTIRANLVLGDSAIPSNVSIPNLPPFHLKRFEARCLCQTWKRMKIGPRWRHTGRRGQRDEIVRFWRCEPVFEADPGAVPGRLPGAPRERCARRCNGWFPRTARWLPSEEHGICRLCIPAGVVWTFTRKRWGRACVRLTAADGRGRPRTAADGRGRRGPAVRPPLWNHDR